MSGNAFNEFSLLMKDVLCAFQNHLTVILCRGLRNHPNDLQQEKYFKRWEQPSMWLKLVCRVLKNHMVFHHAGENG